MDTRNESPIYAYLIRFLNIRLDNISVHDEARHPHMVCTAEPSWSVMGLIGLDSAKMAIKNCFIRGSVVRYVQIPAGGVDTQLLEDATRRGSS